MIEAIIIEDEKRNASFLTNLLNEYCKEVRLTGEADSVKSGIELILKVNPQLVFLDIEMPDGTAFDLLEKLQGKKFHIVFTSAYDHYALRAIKFSAIDYLLKPINFKELQAVIAKVKLKDVDMANINMLIKSLSSSTEKIALPTNDGHIFVDINDIVRFEADGNYTYVHLSKGDKIIASRNLKEFESYVSENDFVRIHHSHLINIHHIKKYIKGNGGYVVLDDGSTAEVSSRRKEEFFHKMKIKG